mgnify:CR=1 FL=1
MHSDHITMGDIAYSVATGNESTMRRLEDRVASLEATVQQLVDHDEDVVNAINMLADYLGLSRD